MKALSGKADQIDFQDMAADHPQTDGFPLLPGFISFYRRGQLNKREASQVYAVNDLDLLDAGISLQQHIPAHLAKR